jgi:serine kinase of HPr protein (carbohydrate metabolism regulator)
MTTAATVHASAVKVGDRAVLIRGPSGSGKSRLAFDLILAGRSGQLPPAILVGDDRVHLDTDGEKLWVRPWSTSPHLMPNGCRRRTSSKSTFTVSNYLESPSMPVSHPCR